MNYNDYLTPQNLDLLLKEQSSVCEQSIGYELYTGRLDAILSYVDECGRDAFITIKYFFARDDENTRFFKFDETIINHTDLHYDYSLIDDWVSGKIAEFIADRHAEKAY